MEERLLELEIQARLLDPDAGTRALISDKTSKYAEAFLESLPSQPGYGVRPLEQLGQLPIGENGYSIDRLLEILDAEVDCNGINTASGRHLGYIPGGGLWTSAIADMLAAITNRYAGVAFSNPGAARIEDIVIRWLMTVVGYPATAYGNLTSGGSIANLIALEAARDHFRKGGVPIAASVIYYSSHIHHCVHKALHTTGLDHAQRRIIPMNDAFQMDVTALAKQVTIDQKGGLLPFLVIASAGTTDTGAIDPLNQIADCCDQTGMWMHVDAAYGGFFMLVDKLRKNFQGIERSDSVVLDPHKTLFIPYGSGAVLLRDRNILLTTFAQQAAYMMDSYGMEAISSCDTGIELSRHNRSLRMWLPLQLYGTAPFSAALEEKLLLCAYFHERIQSLGFETATKPELSICVFRWPENPDNVINQELIKAIHADGRVFLSSTKIDDKLWLRCAVVSHRTHLKEIDLALHMVEEQINRVLSTNNPND